MTENPNQSPESTPRRGGLLAGLLKLVVLLALAGGVAWLWWRTETLHAALDALQAREAQTEMRQGEAIDTAKQESATIAAFDSRLAGYDQAVGRLTDEVHGGRSRFQLAAVENLLLAANERVQLQHDARGAIAALELADQRLAGLSEPRLFKLRDTITQERAALMAVPQPDLTSAALTLASLIGRVPQLPLRARVPDHVEGSHVQIDVPAGANWAQRAWASALQALSSVFSLRRNDGPSPRLLPPDEEALVYQVLALKLEGARVALLSRDADGFRALCDAALRWIGDYYRPDDPAVMAARSDLERLKALPIDAPLPEITRSLALLRAYLDAPAP